MKKLLTVVALTALATSLFAADGTVGFSNGTGLVQKWTDMQNSALVNVPRGGGFVQLYWAPGGSAYTDWAKQSPTAWYALNPLWKLQGTPTGFTTPAAGKFNGGSQTLAGLTAGANIDYVVVGWTGTAASFDAAYSDAAAMLGVSAKFTSATGNAGDPPSPSVPLSGSFGGMTLAPIPEPSTFALAGLGAAALLIFRRRS
jgi:hypothetical protein